MIFDDDMLRLGAKYFLTVFTRRGFEILMKCVLSRVNGRHKMTETSSSRQGGASAARAKFQTEA